MDSSKEPLVYILIPVFNSWDYTKNCLDALNKINYQNFKIIVINDGSTDQTSEKLRQEYPEVIEVKGNGNLWWSGCLNRGIQYLFDAYIEPDYVLILNNDTIVDQDFLKYLINFCEERPQTIASSKLLDVDQRNLIWMFGNYLNKWKGLTFNGHNEIDGPAFMKTIEFDTLDGTSTLFPFSIFKSLNLRWDEKFFPMYYGDTDFVLRVKQKGFKSFVVGQSIVYCFGGKHSVSTSYENYTFVDLVKFIGSPKSYFHPKLAVRFYGRHCGFLSGITLGMKSLWLLIKLFVDKYGRNILMKSHLFKIARYLKKTLIRPFVLFVIKKKSFFDNRFEWYLRAFTLLRLQPQIKICLFKKMRDMIGSKDLEIDIVIPVTKKDYDILPMVIDSGRMYIKHRIKKIIVVAAIDEQIKDLCQKKNCLLIDEDIVLPIKKQEIDYVVHNQDRSGWLFQQLLKLHSNTMSNSEFILVLDADTVFLRPIYFREKDRNIFYVSDEYHLPYFDFIKRVCDFKKISLVSFVSHGMLFESRKLLHLKTSMEKKYKQNWSKIIVDHCDKSIASCFSEYETYGNFVFNNFPQEMLINYWFNLALSSDVLKENNFHDLQKKFSSHYRTISFHSYLKENDADLKGV